MSIVKFKVANWNDKPSRIEYVKQTACFYVLGNGRRDSISSLYHQFFDTEADAIGFIEQRKANRIRGMEVDRIKKHAVELLEAAERYLNFRHTGDIGMGHEYSGEHPQTQLKSVIAKAKGET